VLIMILTTKEIKQQLKMDEDYSLEDDWIERAALAAEARAATFLNCPLYANESDIPEEDTRGMVIPSEVRQAMLQVITTWYYNRLSISEVEKTEIPMSWKFNLEPHRLRNI